MIQSYLGTKGEQARLKQMKVTGKGTLKAINIPIRNKHKQYIKSQRYQHKHKYTIHRKPKISTTLQMFAMHKDKFCTCAGVQCSSHIIFSKVALYSYTLLCTRD